MANVNIIQDDVTGTLNFHDATNWDDLKFPAQGINPPGAASDPDRDATDGTWLFDAGSTEVLIGIAQMPHSWEEGTPILPHVHWQATDGNAGDVYWRFEYNIADVNGDFAGSFTALNTLDSAVSNANTHLIKGFGSVDMSGHKLSCIIKWKVSRIGGDGTDTYAADAKLLEVDFHYQIGSIGSGEQFTK